MKRIKVIHIIPDFPSGGAEQVVLTYLRKFKDDNEFDVSAISLSLNQDRLYEKLAEEESLAIHYLGLNMSDYSLLSRLKQLLALHKYLKQIKPDIIHIHLSILWFVCIASIGLKFKSIFHTLHSDPIKTSYGIHVYVDRFCYWAFNVRPICLNQEMKLKSDHLFKTNKTLVLRNGIDIDKYKKNDKNYLRSSLGIAQGNLLIGHIGRFHPVKNHKKIITVFEQVLHICPDSKLLLVGEGETQRDIKEMVRQRNIQNNVFFLGVRNDIPEILSSLDRFIFPSEFEGLGIALIEAQAAGVFCVISDTIPTEAIVTKDVTRLPIDADNKIWAKAIIEAKKSINQSTLTLADYDIKNIVNTLKTYYRLS